VDMFHCRLPRGLRVGRGLPEDRATLGHLGKWAEVRGSAFNSTALPRHPALLPVGQGLLIRFMKTLPTEPRQSKPR
jgi:hypothetical protein